MPSPKTYIVNDQATETDALDFTPYVEILADIIQTRNTPLTIGVFDTLNCKLVKSINNSERILCPLDLVKEISQENQ
jgi:hypothetical protein